MKLLGIGDWGLGIGDWGLGIGPNTQTPKPKTPNPVFFFLILNKNFFEYIFL